MDNAVAKVDEKKYALSMMTTNQVDLIKRTICKGATDDELELFLHVCNKLGLDPFVRQIYAVKRKAKKPDGNWGEIMVLQTGIDGYRLLAERTGKYMPGKETVYAYDSQGRLMSATAYVKKFGPDKQWHDISATAYWNEYVQTDKENNPLQFWLKMPHGQLGKCAESLAIRKAFPSDLSGIYTKEEMDQADSETLLSLKQVAKPDVTLEVEAEAAPSSIEYISGIEAQEIENLISPDDTEYRANLLNYFKADSFYKLQKKSLAACMRSVNKRLAEKTKDSEIPF